MSKLNFIKIFNRCIQSENGCWEWQGSLVRGYACTSKRYLTENGKRKTINFRLNRFSYQHFNGDLKKEELVLHICDNKKCINPEHLYSGTEKDNAMDRVKRNPITYATLKANAIKKRKLCESDIKEIKRLRIQGFTMKNLSNKFKVSSSIISDILTGKRWGFVI